MLMSYKLVIMLTRNQIIQTLNQLELKRDRIGASQDQVAQMLGIHKNTFRNWKSSGFTQMQVSDLMNLLDVLEKLDFHNRSSRYVEVVK
jgi:DNA-binding transcriptional regulator YiaG